MKIDYLRLSLTDRCNLNCVYCAPLGRESFLRREEVLTLEETVRAAAAFVKAGVRKIRLTGGEPLLRKNIVGLTAMLRSLPGLEELALTTNGLELARFALALREAGLDGVNLSLNTLKKEKFARIAGGDGFQRVLEGLEAALAAGFGKVKLNVIVMKGINDDEIVPFARLAAERPVTVRFIEYFRTNERSGLPAGAFIPNTEVKAAVAAALGPLICLPAEARSGPARRFTFSGAKGELGFISNRTSDFCAGCNRVRMDCAGRVYPCLFGPPLRELRTALREGKDAEAEELVRGIFLVKSQYRKDAAALPRVEMSHIGG